MFDASHTRGRSRRKNMFSRDTLASIKAPISGRISHFRSISSRPCTMARVAAVLQLAATAILVHCAHAVRIVSGPPQTSIPRDPLSVSPDPPGELDFSDPRLARTVTDFQPEGLHLQQWTSDSVLVSWQTGAEAVFPTGSAPSRPPYDPTSVAAYVKYGVQSGKYAWTIRGNDSTVYSQVYDARGGGTTYLSPILHHVRLSNLKPGVTYFYTVGNDADGWSPEKSFTLPKPGFPLRFGFIGDLGETANSSDTLQHLAYSNPGGPLSPPSSSCVQIPCSHSGAPRWQGWWWQQQGGQQGMARLVGQLQHAMFCIGQSSVQPAWQGPSRPYHQAACPPPPNTHTHTLQAFMDDKAARSASSQAWCDLPVNLAKPTASFQLPSYQPTPGARTPITLQNGDFCPSKQPEWSAFRQPSFGHGTLDILSPTTARWRWHRNNQGFAEVADEVVLARGGGRRGEDGKAQKRRGM
ncbi:hypothetical protein ABPG75_009624 [Micractinium tetrahymenae]